MKHAITEKLAISFFSRGDARLIVRLCERCGRIFPALADAESAGECPDDLWGTAAGGGTTPKTGGLDALGVLNEINVWRIMVRAVMTRPKKDMDTLGVLANAIDRLISRFEGQGTEIPAASEPEGQVR